MTAALGWALAAATTASSVVLARLLAARMELVARASHELRGPLQAAWLGLHGLGRDRPPIGTAGAIEPKPGRGALADRSARVAAIAIELRRAALVLDDLDAARSGRRIRDRRETVLVADLIADTAASWRPVARALGAELRFEPGAGAAVRGDRMRLAQACGNLVANAIEHGGGEVRVRAREAGARVRIEVSDGGPGLPAPVDQLVRRPRAGRGRRGRGLAITAEIASRHGGRIAAAPSSRGARVALELPVATPRA